RKLPWTRAPRGSRARCRRGPLYNRAASAPSSFTARAFRAPSERTGGRELLSRTPLRASPFLRPHRGATGPVSELSLSRGRKPGGRERASRRGWIPRRSSTAANITGGGVGSSRPAAARSSAAGIATTTPRTRSRWMCATGTRFLATRSKGLSALSAPKNRMCSRIALTVGPAWENTSAKYATSSMTMSIRTNTTVTDVAYAGKTGGADNFFHCDICGCCYSNVLKDSHRCVERAMHHNCPVCFEYLFDSTKDISVLQCGHTIHLECMNEMRLHHHFSCPVCSRSACDMTDTWRKLDEEVAATPMPDIYQKKMIWILCNDCSATSNVRFHVLGHKCPGCSSYNTRETKAGPAPAACSRV
ncbi:hypothetical protein EJB05_22109, partial [Eragrostis curvula]